MSQSESSYDFGEAQSIENGYTLNSNQLLNQDTFSEGVSLEMHHPISNLRSTFQQLDRDQRGSIRKSALKESIMPNSQLYDVEVLQKQINDCDEDIQFSRFIEIFQRANIGDKVNKWLFTLYDKEQKGFIDDFDIRRVAQITGVELNQEEIFGMLKTQRNQQNGRVDFQDFKYIMEENILFL